MGRPFPPFFSQLKVFQSLVIRPVGLVIPNNCSLKCDKTPSFKRSLLKVRVVVSGYRLPTLVGKLCVHSLSQSFASRKAQQILTPAVGCLYSVTAVKMSLWFYCQIFRYILHVTGIVRVPCCSSCIEWAEELRFGLCEGLRQAARWNILLNCIYMLCLKSQLLNFRSSRQSLETSFI